MSIVIILHWDDSSPRKVVGPFKDEQEAYAFLCFHSLNEMGFHFVPYTTLTAFNPEEFKC